MRTIVVRALASLLTVLFVFGFFCARALLSIRTPRPGDILHECDTKEVISAVEKAFAADLPSDLRKIKAAKWN